MATCCMSTRGTRRAPGEIEDDFSLMIADVASRILRREVELVVVLPKVL